MALRVTIGGVEAASVIDWAVGPIVITDTMGERPVATFACTWDEIPARFSEVVIYEDDETTKAFGGIVLHRKVSPVYQRAKPSRCFVECVGYFAYGDYCYITLTIDEPVDASEVIDAIVTEKLSAYGITYTPEETGVTVQKVAWQRKRVSDALRELGVPVRIDPDKVLTTFVPGEEEAPFAINDTDPKIYDISWEDEGEIPPNTITMICGAGKRPAVEQFTSDGTQTSYTTAYPASQTWDDPYPNVVVVDGSPVAVAGWGPDQLPAGSWYWDAPTHTLVNGTGTPLSNGAVVTIAYTREDPFEVTDDTGATPPIEEVIVRPDILYREQAIDQIALRLAQLGPTAAKRAEIHTREPGLAVGQGIPTDTDYRGGIDDTLIVQTVRTEIRSDDVRHYFADATSEIAIRRSTLGEWRELVSAAGASGSGSVLSVVSGGSSGGGGVVVPVAAPPWVYLGGSRSTSETIDSSGTYEAIPQAVPFVAPSTYSARVRVQLRSADSGVEVTARLRNLTDGTTAGTSAAVENTAFEETTFVVSIVAGKRYQLEVTADTTGARVYAFGTLEALS